MFSILTNLKNYLKFVPKFFDFLNVFYSKKNKSIRPYFGVYFRNFGGPNIRTKRLIKHFGNFLINPNIIYAQSFWSEIELRDAIKYSVNNQIPIIFNQNGLYYKGWFKGNYKAKNDMISLVQKKSKFIFFQSNFCKKSSIFFTKYKPKKSKILYNSIPKKISKNRNVNTPKVFNILISGYFKNENLYIVKPAINVIYKLAKSTKFNHKLIIYGLKISELDTNLKKKVLFLMDKNKIEIKDNYNIKNLSNILKDIHLALHLKYKDPCPNAVLERMHFGIPHIISNSGGTPELTGKSSINIKVKDTWQTLVKVDERKLYKAIIIGSKKYNLLRNNTYRQIKRFNWKNYIIEHKKIFLRYIN